MLSTIRLFKALPVDKHSSAQTVNEDLMQQTLAKGFIFDSNVLANYQDTSRLIEEVNQAYGRSSEELNQSFHKSFAKIRDASMQQLVFEQMIHYLTTYGAEAMGIYDTDSVYIPGEQLDAPALQDGIRLVVIRGLTKDELKTELLQLLTSGVALHATTLKDVLDVATFVGLTADEVERITNKEAKAALYDYLGIVPTQPIAFLRFVVYRATEQTLLIKNQAMITQLKARTNTDLIRYFDTYEREVGLAHLAEIFYRYKPIFLALRTNTKLKQTINKIRRLATTHHKPMEEDILNTVTATMKHGKLNFMFHEALAQASVFRKIRLAYALKFRTTDADAILYRIRNGKSFATDFTFPYKDDAQKVYEAVMASIVADIHPNIAGQKIFIPTGVNYGLPATEKQFTGNLPSGTSVEITEDMIVGVHWENVGSNRIDLDLSLQNADGKLGWDGGYRDRQQGIYFSGDVTDAPGPQGASELFHVGGRARGSWLLNLNYFNYDEDVPVPFKVFVGHESRDHIESNYVIDPNKIVALSTTEATTRQKNLGLIVADEQSTRFYFVESNLGNRISARVNAHTEQARKYLLHAATNAIGLNDVLVAAGAELVSDASQADINLSPEAIDKTTILGLLTKDTEIERKPAAAE